MGKAADLSDDEILGIMAFLPFSSLVRAGAVCKRWHRLVVVTESKQLTSWCILSCPVKIPPPTEEFELLKWKLTRSGSVRKRLSRSGSSSRHDSAGAARDNFHVVMFDPFARKWLKVANGFGYKGPFASSTRELLWVPSTGGYSGLVCVFEWEEESCHKHNTYWVGNPISGDWKCIVGPSPWRGVHQLVVNPTTKTYKIISIRWERLLLADVPTGVWRAAIYDSEVDQWRRGSHFSVPEARSGTPYSLSSRTHTASEKMMYLLMYRAGKLLNWETYTEIQILGYDIERDSFNFVTPLSRFDHCLEYFEPTSCRDWPVHLVLESDQLTLTKTRKVTENIARGDRDLSSPTQSADPPCPILVICSTANVRRLSWYPHEIFQTIINSIKCRPRSFHEEFLNKLCILKFNPVKGSWDVKEKSSLQVTGKFYSKHRVFQCAGDRLEHLYYAHLDEDQSVVVYNAKKDDFSTWSRLPPLGAEYGGCIARNYHSLGSFVPRLDAAP